MYTHFFSLQEREKAHTKGELNPTNQVRTTGKTILENKSYLPLIVKHEPVENIRLTKDKFMCNFLNLTTGLVCFLCRNVRESYANFTNPCNLSHDSVRSRTQTLTFSPALTPMTPK